jgi:hypothetical protein
MPRDINQPLRPPRSGSTPHDVDAQSAALESRSSSQLVPNRSPWRSQRHRISVNSDTPIFAHRSSQAARSRLSATHHSPIPPRSILSRTLDPAQIPIAPEPRPAPPSAVSSLGGFRTPAPGGRRTIVMGPASENLHNSGHCRCSRIGSYGTVRRCLVTPA